MARPSTGFRWATAAGAYVSAIAAAIRNLGWVPNTTAIVQEVNQSLNEIGEWLEYYDTDIFPADRVLNIGRIVGDIDPIDAWGLSIVVPDNGAGVGSNLFIECARATGVAAIQAFEVALQTQGAGGVAGLYTVGGAGQYFEVSPSVENTGTGLAIEADPVTDTRYAYPAGDELDITIDVSPADGGWTLYQDDSSAELIWRWSGATEVEGAYVENIGAGAHDVIAKRPLPVVGNPEADGTTTRYTVVSLTADFDGTGTDNKIQLIRQLRASTYDADILLAVDPDNETDNNGGTPQALDMTTYRYYMRMVEPALGAAGTTNVVRTVTLVLRKRAVE